jgi:predicted HicB family RNase H-like nuclease
MDKLLKYKKYVGTIEYDLKDNILYGHVLFVRSSLQYQGETLEELQKDFESAIDEYLTFCKNRGIEPEKGFSGTFNIRTGEELHRKLVTIAKEKELSLNAFITQSLEKIVDNPDLIL